MAKKKTGLWDKPLEPLPGGWVSWESAKMRWAWIQAAGFNLARVSEDGTFEPILRFDTLALAMAWTFGFESGLAYRAHERAAQAGKEGG